MFLLNKKTFFGFLALICVVIILFGGAKNVSAQTTTCYSPMTNAVADATQFDTDAKQACAEVGRTDVSQCVAEMRDAFCTTTNASSTPTTQTPSTSNGSGNLGSDVLGITVPVIGVAAKGILYILNILVGVFISLAGFLVGWALQFNLSILTFEPSFMKVGWTIFRDIANLGFVLGIIIIAVATILRYKNYTAKQILWKLIVAALIVNFSLVIGGALITVSNSVSSYLLNAMGSNGGAGAVAQIGDSFGFIKIVTDVSSWSALGTLANVIGFGDGASLSMLAALAVILLFGIVFLFTLLGLAGMFLLRYFNLVFLLMISPVVWLLWIFPDTNKYFRDWWTKFLHWIQFAPIMLVFLYISLSILSKWSSYQASIEGSLGTNYSFMGIFGDTGGTNKLRFGTLMVAIVACALLVGGLKVAQAMGVGGTKMAMGAFDKTKGWAQKRVQKVQKGAGAVAQRTGAKVGSYTLNKKFKTVDKDGNSIERKSLKEKIQEKGTTKWGKALGIGALSRSTMLADEELKKTSYGSVEEIKKKYANLPPDEFQKALDTFVSGKMGGVTGGSSAQVAFYEMMAEKDKLGDVSSHDPSELRKVFDILDRRGKGKTAGDIQKKLGLNSTAVDYLIKAKTGDATAKQSAITEMEKVYNSMSDDDFKAYMKNVGGNIMKGKGGLFGTDEKDDSISQHFRSMFLEDSKGDSSVIREISSSVKNKYNKKTGALEGEDYVSQTNAELIGAQIQWFRDEINQFETETVAYGARQGTPGFNQKEYDKKLGRLSVLKHQLQTFGDTFDNLVTYTQTSSGAPRPVPNAGANFSDLVELMKNSETCSYADLRDAARGIKIV